jgi:hypothetical protein
MAEAGPEDIAILAAAIPAARMVLSDRAVMIVPSV